MKRMKKMLSYFLLLTMVASLMPVNIVRAQVAEEKLEKIVIEPSFKVSEIQTSLASQTAYALDSNGNPTIKSTNEIEWIDRLADLPSYAEDLYDWLIENSDGDGSEDALIDVTDGTNMEGDYVYPIVSYEQEEVAFSYTPGASDEEIQDAASEVFSEVATENFETVFAYAEAVFTAFDRDHPEVFWLSGESMCVHGCGAEIHITSDRDGNGKLVYDQTVYFCLYLADEVDGFDIRAEEYRDEDEIYDAIDEIDGIVSEVVADATGTRAEKLAHFNSWLTTNNCYNNSANLYDIPFDCNECTSAFRGQTGANGPVCEAYARALKVLCDEAGIPCVLVNGIALDEHHMWNNVQMPDGKWYAVDSTWNDPVVDGVTSKVSGSENEDFLLVGGSTVIDGEKFEDSHQVTNIAVQDGVAFTNGPVLAEDAYVDNGEPEHTHSYTKTVTAPTCTKDGYTTYKCECGDTYTGDEVTALGHAWDNGSVTKEPTETETGVRTYTCETCGETKTETIATNNDTEKTELPYTDVSEAAWYYDSVKYVHENELMKGITATTFEPDTKLTRAMFATILYRANGEPEVEYKDIFPDVVEGAWYTDGIIWAYEAGIVNGYTDGNFGTNDNITREQLAVMMYRYADYMGYDTSKTASFDDFKDGDKVSSWAVDAMKWAVGNEIINGKSGNVLDPQGQASRAECATIIMRFMQLYEE